MRSPTVVVLGGAGMLGHKLFQHLRGRFPDTRATMRRSASQPLLDRVSLLRGPDVVSGVDADDFDSLSARLREWRPDVTINCIGVVKQRSQASQAIPSITINALLPHRLAEVTSEWGGRLIHFSTDCVFSGRKGMYVEDDPSDAADLYGRSKFLGEVAAPNALTLRTSIIGRELSGHRSLLEWFRRQNGGRVEGFKGAIYSGVTTNEMALVVTRVIVDSAGLSGLYQVASEPISKYDLLVLMRDAYRLDIQVDAANEERCDRSMSSVRFASATGWRAPSWPEMVQAMADDTTPYADWQVVAPGCERLELKSV